MGKRQGIVWFGELGKSEIEGFGCETIYFSARMSFSLKCVMEGTKKSELFTLGYFFSIFEQDLDMNVGELKSPLFLTVLDLLSHFSFRRLTVVLPSIV